MTQATVASISSARPRSSAATASAALAVTRRSVITSSMCTSGLWLNPESAMRINHLRYPMLRTTKQPNACSHTVVSA